MKINAFSLIELLVVIAIVAILTAVAVPQYKSYLVKTRITNMLNIADTLVKKQEQFYSKNGRFANSTELNGIIAGPCGACADPSTLGPNASSMITEIVIADNPYPAPSGCYNNGAVDLHFIDTIVGNEFWLRLRLVVDDNGVMQTFCVNDGLTAFPVANCSNSTDWSKYLTALSAACP